MTTWIINFYHTEAIYKTGIVSFSQKRTDPGEAIYIPIFDSLKLRKRESWLS